MTLTGWARRTAAVIALCAACAAVAVIVASAGGARDQLDCSTYKFDRTRWLTSADEQDGPRGGLFNDLVACRRLIGKTRPEVRAMLGRPGSAAGGQWSYYLANCGIDTCRGYVTFGPAKRVVQAYQGEG